MIENDLFQEHQALCHKLQMFINQARINEQKLARFQDLELRLISTRGLNELILQILNNYKNEFSLDTVTLTILDENYEIQRIIQESHADPDMSNLLFCHNLDQLNEFFPTPIKPVLGEFDLSRHALFLSPLSPPIKSIANIPLVRYGKLIGSLNLGSESRERFNRDFGTEFLQRLATIVAICLENTSNHERLKRVGLTDSLTGVNNRRFFDQRLGEELARSLRSREPLACLFIDIDHFKATNDQHGHQV
ncbi:MAG: GGDEF domain-containing protein, partial [Thiohalomonadales bacterium]